MGGFFPSSPADPSFPPVVPSPPPPVSNPPTSPGAFLPLASTFRFPFSVFRYPPLPPRLVYVPQVRQNVYRRDGDIPPPRKRRKADVLTCECPTRENACGPDCLNRTMRVICDPRTHPGVHACGNGPWQKLEPAPTELFYTSGGKGWGVRATAPLPPGTLIGEYCGEIITPQVKKHEMINENRSPP